MGGSHTPGPWSHGLDLDPPDPGIEGPGGGCVAHVQCHGNVNTIARCGEQFSHADARLVAAAPDLLAACEAWLEYLDPADNAYSEAETQLIRRMQAAVAKARGEG